jgi:hypothetical protein
VPEVTVEYRQFILDGSRDGVLFGDVHGLEEGGGSRNRHRFGNVADGQADIESGNLLCAHVDCLGDRRLEPFALYGGLVAAGAKRAGREIARLVGGAREFLVGVDVGHHDLCDRYGGPIGISYADDESA